MQAGGAFFRKKNTLNEPGMSEERLTAVFGGTFDPVHYGHTGLAEHLLETGLVTRVVFLPALHPPHKSGFVPAPFADRAEMLRLAIEGHPRMSVSTLEGERPGPSYTVETLDILKERHPGEQFVWIIGTDSLNQLHHWYQAERLVRENRFLSYPRPGDEADEELLRKVWPDDLRRKLTDGVLNGAPEFDISSTSLRERLEAGGVEACRGLAPECVLNYIEQHHLYTKQGVHP